MPTSYPVAINGTNIKPASNFKIARYNVTKSGRTADSYMHMELKGKKKKLFFTYDVISSAELQAILDLIDTDTVFFNVTYYDVNDQAVTKLCYGGEITQELMRRGYVGDKSVWRGVTFDLIEV